MVNVIVSLISPLPLLLLVYRTARGFCVLILYPAALPNLLISSNSLLLLPWVYPTWDSLCFLDLDDSFLCHIRDFFGYYLFKYFLRSFLSPSFSSTTIMWMLMCLMLFQRSLRLSSFLFILFFLLFHGSDFHHAIFQLLLLSHFSCVRLCDSIDGSPQGSPAPGILQARTLKWVAISFSNAWKWKVKVKSLSDPMDCSLPGSSVHGIFQARVLEWDAIAFSIFQLTYPFFCLIFFYYWFLLVYFLFQLLYSSSLCSLSFSRPW